MLKVFELCLSSPTVSNFFTLLFLPFSMVSEPFHRWGGAFHTLGAPFGVRFRRLIRFWTVRYLGVPCSTGSRCCRGCYTVYVMLRLLALVAVLCAVCCAVLPVCVMLCSCVLMFMLMFVLCDVPTPCVFDVFSGYFGNLFGIRHQKVKVYAGHLRCHFLDFFGGSML